MKIRNVSPYGDLDVVALGRVVKRDEVIDIPAPIARALLGQVDNWQPVPPPAAERTES